MFLWTRQRATKVFAGGVMLLALGGLAFAASQLREPEVTWTVDERATLRSLWIGSLEPLPPDPSNAVADDPDAVTLGHKLFFDTRLSSNGQVACATCHVPTDAFQDDRPLAEGVGTTGRRAMPIAGTAYSPWYFWDGRKDSQWAQALGPLESPVEHGGNRTQYAHVIAQHYQAEYEALFGPLPDLSDETRFPASAGPVPDPEARQAWDEMAPEDREAVSRIYANIGKAIAAYERRILPGPARFDAYVEAVLQGDQETMESALSEDEVAGLKLFIGRAGCVECHNGPLFSDGDFHNIGVPAAPELPEDVGRAAGAEQVQEDEFNCLSPYSDADPEDCGELQFINDSEPTLVGAFKTSMLRNVAEQAFFMHAGQLDSLEAVLVHYNEAPAAPVGQTELEPLSLSDEELAQLEAFLRSLGAPLATEPELLGAPE